MSGEEVTIIILDKLDDSFVQDIQFFMGDFKDPIDEVSEALEKAKDEDKVYEAVLDSGKRVGLIVFFETGFEKFQPRYHLAYIAVHPGYRGLSIGRKLLEKVIEVTGGSFSLHVGPKNEGAIAFYERMGLEKAYVRMVKK